MQNNPPDEKPIIPIIAKFGMNDLATLIANECKRLGVVGNIDINFHVDKDGISATVKYKDEPSRIII